METFIGLATGIVSVVGVLLGVPDFFKTPPPDKGQLVAVVEDAKTQKALSGATVEILTGKNAVLNTLTTNWFGRASHHLDEGQYRVRVKHPKFSDEIQPVQIVSGQTTELQVRLRSGAPALHQVERAINKGVSAVRRLFE